MQEFCDSAISWSSVFKLFANILAVVTGIVQTWFCRHYDYENPETHFFFEIWNLYQALGTSSPLVLVLDSV